MFNFSEHVSMKIMSAGQANIRTAKTPGGSIDHALDQTTTLSLREYYQQWSLHYDNDVSAQDYCGPTVMVDFLHSVPAAVAMGPDCRVMDACCGTGLVGRVLKARGFDHVDGCDLSPAMVEQARTRAAYRHLYGDLDLTRPVPERLQHRYDLVLCCGAFIPGHLPPSGLGGLIDLTRPGGLIVLSVRAAYYADTAFQGYCQGLQRAQRLTLLDSCLNGPYLRDVQAHYLAFQVN
jgi:predicted TPR repeat methyltransferase